MASRPHRRPNKLATAIPRSRVCRVCLERGHGEKSLGASTATSVALRALGQSDGGRLTATCEINDGPFPLQLIRSVLSACVLFS